MSGMRYNYGMLYKRVHSLISAKSCRWIFEDTAINYGRIEIVQETWLEKRDSSLSVFIVKQEYLDGLRARQAPIEPSLHPHKNPEAHRQAFGNPNYLKFLWLTHKYRHAWQGRGSTFEIILSVTRFKKGLNWAWRVGKTLKFCKNSVTPSNARKYQELWNEEG